MHCSSLQSRRVAMHMRSLGTLKHLRPVYSTLRQVHAQATSTAVQEVSFVPTGMAPEAPSTYRQLPINYAAETRFTVDSVAAADEARFKLHPSVEFWSNYSTKAILRTMNHTPQDHPNSTGRLMELAATARDLLATSATSDAESAGYWAYHLGRAGLFLGTSAAGAVAHHLATQVQALRNGESVRTPWDNLSANAGAELTNRLAEAIAMWQQDLANIKAGWYKLPWDMTTLTHRQYNPIYIMSRSAQFVSEAISTLNRRVSNASPDNWFSSNMYPDYYADNTFHYQSDGWLSDRSAAVYEFSTEALFFGRQDAMQRNSLLPLAEYIRSKGLNPANMKVVEVSCGTGRFHTFLKDNWPTLRTIASDLSPFYLARARDNVNYWKRQRAAELDLGGKDNTGTEYMQCAMESMPLADASVDAVICVYAFHEMPEEARVAAATEFYRVLKPGGLAVLTDSVQLGDRPQWDKTLGAFGNFNEPHYKNYIACDNGGVFEAAGFSCDSKYLASASKTLSFIKPQHSGFGSAATGFSNSSLDVIADSTLAAHASGAAAVAAKWN